jgi:hypothetical protein
MILSLGSSTSRTDVLLAEYPLFVFRNYVRSSSAFFGPSIANHDRRSIGDIHLSLVGIFSIQRLNANSQIHSVNSAKELIELCQEIVDSGYSLSGSFMAL